jgi:Xaa-Pro aminopeptidase
MHGHGIVAEKVEQALRLLQELGIDAWLTFVRETTEAGDPVVPLVLGQNLTWQSALVLSRRGDRVAIVGKYEDDAVRSGGVWTEVVPYVQSIREPLREALRRLDPASIAVNFSLDDVKADGLSHGMFLLLLEHLSGTPWAERLVPASRLIALLRGRKTSGEIRRIREAVGVAESIFQELAGFARPGRTEAEIARFMRDAASRRQAGPAWDARQCPIVTTGPDSMTGHGFPSETLAVRRGCLLHVDFGVRLEEYCSDLQRVWYVPRQGETSPPPEALRAFETVRGAIGAAAAQLGPGVPGWRVDEVARGVVIGAGYPPYEHATGHQVGRSAHDGGCVLGPRWERYGRTPHYALEPGNVVTLELGIEVPGRGYLGQEEMLLVTPDGCEFISKPQAALPLLR